MAPKKKGSGAKTATPKEDGSAGSRKSSLSGVWQIPDRGIFYLAIVGLAFIAARRLGGQPIPDAGTGPAGDLLRLGRKTEGVELHVVSRDFGDTGRGLAATRDFAVGDVVMELPLEEVAYIGKHNLPMPFRIHRASKMILDGNLGQKQTLALAFLFELRKEDSHWAPFFKSVPERINNLAVMGPLHRRVLNGTDVAGKFKNMDELFESTKEILKITRSLFSPAVEDDELKWALAVVESRAHDSRNQLVLWPFISLTNHHYDVNKTLQYHSGTSRGPLVTDSPTRVVQFQARGSIKAGDQVFLSYGPYSNLRLLVQYGFTIPNNSVLDTTPIKLLKLLGAELFKFGSKLADRGLDCKGISRDTRLILRRSNVLPLRLPELLVSCWRLSKFEDLAEARTAADAGFFEMSNHIEVHAAKNLTWLERDAEAFDEISAACSDLRKEYVVEDGHALEELKQLQDDLSRQLSSALQEEIQAWDDCISVATRRAAECRTRAAATGQ